jgi:endonuclease III
MILGKRNEQIGQLTEVIEQLASDLESASKTDEELRRLCTVPGIGPVTAGCVRHGYPAAESMNIRPPVPRASGHPRLRACGAI